MDALRCPNLRTRSGRFINNYLFDSACASCYQEGNGLITDRGGNPDYVHNIIY